ncbi:transposable element Tcb2 transposase [Trichonephila clavipes]|uniref:Transposable element Tcb2 transposase n=1 Tax=Trichonephila clavipes TaxID=2585209 RepID=A0A8X6SDV5_TRICX|nr:transposable element Tcb2 transposase [Trichonephila clavipes]
MPLRHFRRQYEQLSQFERGRIIGMMEAGWSAKRVARQLGRSDCVLTRCWDQWIRDMSLTRRPGSGRARQTSRRENHHIVVFSNESRLNLSSDDNCVRVWRPRGERLNPAFALQRHIAPTAGVMFYRPSNVVLLIAVPQGIDLNPGEGMDVCKRIVPVRQKGTQKQQSSPRSSREVGRKKRELAVPDYA